ncbi:MAG: tetratricopeptide repeat protein [Planctomycetota bacterium]|jgi:tetratricopeptide (TPR) repeat protein
MAKRKKINRRVLILMLVIGLAVVGLFALALLGTSRGKNLVNRLFPKDPAPYLARADKAFDAGDYKTALKEYGDAIRAQRTRGEAGENAETYYKLAITNKMYVANTPDLTAVRRTKHQQNIWTMLDKSLNIDANFLASRRELSELLWLVTMSAQLRGQSDAVDWNAFTDQVTKLIDLLEDGEERAEAYYRRGKAWSYLMASEPDSYEKAVADFDEAIRLVPTNETYWLNGKFQLLTTLGDFEAAEATIQEAIAANPSSASVHISYSQLLGQTDRKEEAIQEIEKAIKLEPDNPMGMLAKAEYHVSLRQLPEALSAVEEAQRVAPDSLDVYYMKGFVLQGLDRWSECSEAYRQGLAAVDRMMAETVDSAEDRNRRKWLEERKADIYFGLADAVLNERRRAADLTDEQKAECVATAEECLDRIDELIGPDQQLKRRSRDKIRGRIKYIQGDVGAALTLLESSYNELIKQNEFDSQVALILTDVYLRNGLPGKAERIVDRLMESSAGASPLVTLYKSRILIQYREYPRAARLLRGLLRRYPDHAAAKQLLTLIEIQGGEIDRLPEGVTPPAEVVVLMLGRIDEKLLDGQRDQALALAQHLYERVPDHRGALRRLLGIYLQRGQASRARALLMEAIERDPDDQSLKDQLTMLNLPNDEARFQARLEMAEQKEDPYERALAKASVYLVANKPEEFIALLEEASQLAEPQDKARLIERLFTIALGRKEWEKAEGYVQIATDENLDGAGGALLAAQLDIQRERYDAAVDKLSDVLREQPYRKPARMLLGQCYLQQEKYNEAATEFEAVWQSDPSYVQAAIQMIRVADAMAKPQEWEDWVRRAYRLAPRNIYVRSSYLELLENQKGGGADLEEIIRQRESIRAASPSDLVNLEGLARLYEKTGQLKQAEQRHLELLERSPDKVGSAGLLIDFYGRTRQTAMVDKIISQLLIQARTPSEKIRVYLLHSRFQANRNVDQALLVLDQAIEIDPKDPRPHRAKATLMGFTVPARWQEGIDSLKTYLELAGDEEDGSGLRDLARYCIEAGQYDQARKIISDLLAEDPSNAEVQTLAAVLVYKSGDAKRAKELLGEILVEHPEYAPALVQRSQIYQDEGDLYKAKEDLNKAVDIVGGYRLLMALADLHIQNGDISSAQSTLEELNRRYRDYEPGARKLARLWLDGRNWSRLPGYLKEAQERFPRSLVFKEYEAEMWRARGNFARAAKATGKALEIEPGDVYLLRVYLQELHRAGQDDLVMAAVGEYADLPDMGWVRAAEARVLMSSDEQKAENLFAKTVTDASVGALEFVIQQYRATSDLEGTCSKIVAWFPLRPTDWRIREIAGNLFREKGDSDSSLRFLREALALAAKAPAQTKEEKTQRDSALLATHLGLGQTFYVIGKFNEAEEAYLSALQIQPKNIFALNNLAYMYASDLKSPERALEMAQRAVHAAPNNGSVLDTYGWTLAQLGDLREATKFLQRAVQFQPSVTSRCHLGWVLERRARGSDALTQYKQAKALVGDDETHPHYEEINSAIERLSKE